LRAWVVAGCLGSAGSLALITLLGGAGIAAALMPAVVSLGVFNGMFAVAAIGAMMALAGQGRGAREGTRMGVWGAAQAIAAGFGGLLGAGAVDVMRLGLSSDAQAFGAVFLAEATLFILAALLALRFIQYDGRRAAVAVPGE
jgi:BCD family chlorophyll transporter-like MFS transporter